MLRVSRLTDYATVVLSRMSLAPGRILSASELAEAVGLGVPTVSKVLKLLARDGIVQGARGLRGGYMLARPASEISVAQIVDALEDRPFGLTDCSAEHGRCDIESDCGIRANWVSISAIVRRALEDVSLADMARPAAERPVRFLPQAPTEKTRARTPRDATQLTKESSLR